MAHEDEFLQLLDQAKARLGSDAAIARAVGEQSTTVSDWRHGRKNCTPENQALIAAAAGLDPVATLARATVYRWEGKAKGDLLMKALGKALQATGAVAASVGAAAVLIFSSMSGGQSFDQVSHQLSQAHQAVRLFLRRLLYTMYIMYS